MLLLAARVAVLVAGDPRAASLVPAVESRLAMAGASVIRAEEIASALDPASDATPAPLPALREAEDAYFAARIDEAERLLREAQAALAKNPDAFAERVRASLLAAAIAAKRGDAASAQAAARVALLANPEARADTYPPSVQTIVEAARAALPERVPLKVLSVPESATVTVDGRPVVAGLVVVVPGVHVITARAAGYKTSRRSLNVTKASTFRVTLPLALGAELDGALVAWLTGKAAPPALLGALAEKIGADRVFVISASANEARGGAWTRSGPSALGGPFPFASGESPALAAWAANVGSGVVAIATPVPVATTSPITAPPARTPIVKKPLFWSGVGVVLLGAAAGVALAGSGGTKTETRKGDGETSITW